MSRLRNLVLTGASATALVASGAVAGVAWADPAGCTSSKPTIEILGGYLHGEGVARCNQSALRYFTGEIKWDKNFAPDPLVAKDTMSAYSSYFMELDSCDNGNRRSYYMRTYFNNTSSDHHDSDHRVLTAC
jgi:hypothetical protein